MLKGLKRILGQGGSGERGSSFSSALDALEDDELAFQGAKKRTMETGEPTTFVINDERFEATFVDKQTILTRSLGPAKPRPTT